MEDRTAVFGSQLETDLGDIVSFQDKDPDSLLNTWSKLLRLRRDTPVLQWGAYKTLPKASVEYLSYFPCFEDDRSICLVTLKFPNGY